MITNSMQQRAGLLFLAKNTGRFLLIHENKKWTVPTFERKTVLLEDAEPLLLKFSRGKIVPIELYLSADKGFEYGTYVCLVDCEFLISVEQTFCWTLINDIPKNLHNGLKSTLENSIIKTKIETILELENEIKRQ
jgi:hypothetical protein